MSQIRVLHVIPTLSSGGAERQLVNLVGSTDPKLVEHIVCVIDNATFFGPQVVATGYRVIELNIQKKRPFFKAARAIRQVLATEKPDIVHTWLYDANIATRLGTFGRKRIPIVTSLQLADYEPEAARIANWKPNKVRVLKTIDRFTAFAKKPHFVPCSEFVNTSYQHYYGTKESESTVIYNSVDVGALSSTNEQVLGLRNEFRLPENAFVFLNVGRLDPQKNHATLFDAFKRVLAEMPNAYLLLAGVGGLEEKLKQRVSSLGLESNILFLGRRSDIGALLEFADVFVFPSFFEGLPVALAEAMIKGLSCIASKIGVFEEIIEDGDTGLLVDPHSAEDLAAAMLHLHRDAALRENLASSGAQFAREHFDAKLTAKQWETLYHRIATRDA